jgi:hypothetical protein
MIRIELPERIWLVARATILSAFQANPCSDEAARRILPTCRVEILLDDRRL